MVLESHRPNWTAAAGGEGLKGQGHEDGEDVFCHAMWGSTLAGCPARIQSPGKTNQQQQGYSTQSEWEQLKNCTQHKALLEMVSASAKLQRRALFSMAVQHCRDVVLQHRAPLPTWGRAAEDQELESLMTESLWITFAHGWTSPI